MSVFTRNIVIVLSLWLLFFLATYNLDTYPSVWFDEGMHLQPPKNLVLYGTYALADSGVLHPFPSSVSTGPPLLLPVALVFRGIGMELWLARFVTVNYLMLMAAVFYQLARRLYDGKVGLLALWLMIASPGLGFVPLGRQVMGEVPSLFFFLVGTLIWVKATQCRHPPLLLPASLVLGLAMVTKNVYALILTPGWLLLWVADRWRYRQLDARYFLIPLFTSLACLAIWYGYQVANLGSTTFQQDTLEMGASAGRSIFVLASRRMLAAIRFLLGPDFYLCFGVLGLVYNLYLTIQRKSLQELQRAFLLVVVVVWLAWYVFVSVGWERYAFPALMITALFVARLFLDSCSRLARFLQARTQRSVSATVYALGLVLIAAMLCFLPLRRRSFYEEVIATFGGNDTAAQQFADYLTSHVTSSALIESWEWPIDFFSDHVYHHPPAAMLDVMARHVFLGEPYSSDVYDFEKHNPDYIINGPFSKWTGVYPLDFLRQECTLVISIGDYDLYRVKDSRSDFHE